MAAVTAAAHMFGMHAMALHCQSFCGACAIVLALCRTVFVVVAELDSQISLSGVSLSTATSNRYKIAQQARQPILPLAARTNRSPADNQTARTLRSRRGPHATHC
jgi:hypothetical protein